MLFGKYVIESKSSLTFKPVEDLEIIDILQREYYEPFWTDAQKEEFEARIKELEDKRKKKEEEEAKKTEETAEPTFLDAMKGLWDNAAEAQAVKNQDMVNLMLGDTDSLEQLQINITKAELATQLLVNVKNAAVDAYNEIMRMSI